MSRCRWRCLSLYKGLGMATFFSVLVANMESLMLYVGLLVPFYFVLRAVVETVYCYWLTPRSIRKVMEKQGVNGPKPRFLVGNLMDMSSLTSKSTSSDMDCIRHDIVPRLLPHYVLWSEQFGNTTTHHRHRLKLIANVGSVNQRKLTWNGTNTFGLVN